MSIHLRIPKPCHENWDSMQPNKEGRHCMACRKTVVDFSNMTDREILDYISNASGEVCGRVDSVQLTRGLNENKTRKRFSFLYIWNLLIVLFVFAGKTKAQGAIRYQRLVTVKKCPPKIVEDTGQNLRSVSGIIKNAMTNEPIPFASVMVEGSQHGTSADTAGKFTLLVPAYETTLAISSLGFETAIIRLTESDKEEQIFNLAPMAMEMEPVVVSTSECYKVMVNGAMTSIETVTIYEKFSRELNDWFPKKDVIIYPNPIPAGNSIQAALQLKEKGEYRVDLIDGGGRILWMRKVNINEAKYNLSIPTQNLWSAGVYWLRISGRHTEKVYNGKVVIQ